MAGSVLNSIGHRVRDISSASVLISSRSLCAACARVLAWFKRLSVSVVLSLVHTRKIATALTVTDT